LTGQQCLFDVKFPIQKKPRIDTLVEHLRLKKNEVQWLTYKKINYQFLLEDIYWVKERSLGLLYKDRLYARLKVKKWPDTGVNNNPSALK
jgi:hypothetical protein